MYQSQEHAGLLNLDMFSNYAALLVGPEYVDFDWENLLVLVQHCDLKTSKTPMVHSRLPDFAHQ